MTDSMPDNGVERSSIVHETKPRAVEYLGTHTIWQQGKLKPPIFTPFCKFGLNSHIQNHEVLVMTKHSRS